MGQRSACLCMLYFIGANIISGLIKMTKILKAKDQLLVVVSLWRTGEGDQGGWMGANKISPREFGIYAKINPTPLSSNSAKIAQL
jgi:hypothetical protein